MIVPFSKMPIGPRSNVSKVGSLRVLISSGMHSILIAALGLLATPGATLAAAPIEIVNDHAFVTVSLNGAGPFRFIVDSGAGNLLDPAVAAQIGAKVHGHVRLVGVGGAVENGGITTVRNVRIGTAGFTDQQFVVAETRGALSAAEGPPIDGLIGRDIVGSGITVFDYAHRRIEFDAGNDAIVGGGMTVLPLTTTGGLPQVPCAIAGVAGTCTIDTGSRLAVSVLRSFATRNPGVVPKVISAPGVDGYGIGGPAFGQLGLLSSLNFGAIRLTNIYADFSVQNRGVFADENTAANVGGGMLRRFTLAFDLAHQRIGLRPNDDFYAPYAVDRAGLFLVARRGAIAVLDVRARTPAARAGLVRDDVIVAVDGRQFTPAMLPALRAILAGPANTLVQLQIGHAGASTRMVGLRLAEYL